MGLHYWWEYRKLVEWKAFHDVNLSLCSCRFALFHRAWSRVVLKQKDSKLDNQNANFLWPLYFSGQITAEQSLFTYGPNENVSTFMNKSFVPMFVEDIVFSDNATEQAAKQQCGNDVVCLFDAASTNDVSVGVNSKNVSIKLVEENKKLSKTLISSFLRLHLFPPFLMVKTWLRSRWFSCFYVSS